MYVNITSSHTRNQASWIHTILQHFDSEIKAHPDGYDESAYHDPATVFVDRQSAHTLSKGKVNSPLLCLVLPHQDGSHSWYMYHLLGLPDDRSAGAFKELSGNLAQLAHGATVESDESVHPSDALGASFGQTIKIIGGGIFRFVTHTLGGVAEKALGGILGGLL